LRVNKKGGGWQMNKKVFSAGIITPLIVLFVVFTVIALLVVLDKKQETVPIQHEKLSIIKYDQVIKC